MRGRQANTRAIFAYKYKLFVGRTKFKNKFYLFIQSNVEGTQNTEEYKSTAFYYVKPLRFSSFIPIYLFNFFFFENSYSGVIIKIGCRFLGHFFCALFSFYICSTTQHTHPDGSFSSIFIQIFVNKMINNKLYQVKLFIKIFHIFIEQILCSLFSEKRK